MGNIVKGRKVIKKLSDVMKMRLCDMSIKMNKIENKTQVNKRRYKKKVNEG